MCVGVCTCVYVCVGVCMCVDVCVGVCTCVYVCVGVCMCVDLCCRGILEQVAATCVYLPVPGNSSKAVCIGTISTMGYESYSTLKTQGG